MSLPTKLNAFLITLIFSNCASAVIVEDGFSSQVSDEFVAENSDINANQSRLNDTYENGNGILLHASFTSHESQALELNSLAADQNFSVLPKPNVYDNLVSYAGFENSGIASRADYHGWMTVNLAAAKVDVQEAVTVPEPSSPLLFLGPLVFILWRAGLLPKFIRKH